VQLWVAGRDAIEVHSPEIVHRLLPESTEYHPAGDAGHFSFLTPCGWQMRGVIAVMRLFGAEAICDDPEGFDRTRFHQHFNLEVVRFFSKALG
jgi:predicted dienelactone hydrolase